MTFQVTLTGNVAVVVLRIIAGVCSNAAFVIIICTQKGYVLMQ
jgi:hypothetical protein